MQIMSQWRRECCAEVPEEGFGEGPGNCKGATDSNCSEDQERAGTGWRENH